MAEETDKKRGRDFVQAPSYQAWPKLSSSHEAPGVVLLLYPPSVGRTQRASYSPKRKGVFLRCLSVGGPIFLLFGLLCARFKNINILGNLDIKMETHNDVRAGTSPSQITSIYSVKNSFFPVT